MRKFIMFMAIVSAVSIISGCGNKDSKDPKDPKDQLLDNMISAYGGSENLRKLDSYTSVWAMEIRVKPVKGKAVNFVDQAGRLRVELFYPSRVEKRVINGARGYKGYNDEPLKEVGGPKLDSMKLQLMRLYTPLTLKNKPGIKVTEGQGVKLITLKEGTLVTVYHVNATTFLIEKVAGTLSMGGRKMEFQTEYSDFKKVDGVLMHHRENKFAGGTNTAELFLKELKLLAKHDDKLFNF